MLATCSQFEHGLTLTFEYAPEHDGEPDPGEVVWTWVAYEDDPSKGKDRPVAIVGRWGTRALAGVALTSKLRPEDADRFPVGTGGWDPDGRPSEAKIDRVLYVDPTRVRREGAALERRHFDALVMAITRRHPE